MRATTSKPCGSSCSSPSPRISSSPPASSTASATSSTPPRRNSACASRWRGTGVEEKGYAENGKCVVAVDPRYFRPAEVETLLGDPAKANAKLGWKPKVSFKQLVAEMVREDLKAAERDELVKKHGFTAYDYHE